MLLIYPLIMTSLKLFLKIYCEVTFYTKKKRLCPTWSRNFYSNYIKGTLYKYDKTFQIRDHSGQIKGARITLLYDDALSITSKEF